MSESAMLGRSNPRDLPLRNHFNNPDVIMEEHMVDDLLRGLIMSPMETVDNRVTEEISNHLFEEKGKTKSGMDLIALNIQRGRDHGIPGYNKYREMCKLKRASKFLDFQNEIPLEIIKKLQKTYHHPDDVDLFPGLLSERKLAGALTGPTLACLIGLQFSHLRKCDRFWYESGNHVVKFSLDQLTELRGTSLAGLICRNMDDNSQLPRSAMDQMDRLTNPMVDCSGTIKHLNLEPWREKGPVHTTCEVSDQTVREGETYRASPCTECTCTPSGLQCDTINLFKSGSSCLALVNKWGVKKVEEDNSCRSQCRII
jgi:peroxidase